MDSGSSSKGRKRKTSWHESRHKSFIAITVLPLSHFLFTKLCAKYVDVHSTHCLYKGYKMLVELLLLTTTRVSLRRRDTVPGDVSHKTPFRTQTVLKRGKKTAKREESVWPLDWVGGGEAERNRSRKLNGLILTLNNSSGWPWILLLEVCTY